MLSAVAALLRARMTWDTDRTPHSRASGLGINEFIGENKLLHYNKRYDNIESFFVHFITLD